MVESYILRMKLLFEGNTVKVMNRFGELPPYRRQVGRYSDKYLIPGCLLSFKLDF